jgi:hypothetical protein
VLVVDDVVADLEVVEEPLGVAPAHPGPAVRPAPAGEVGLGQHRELGRAQDRAPLQRGDDDLGGDALGREQVAHAGGRAVAVGADHDAEALGLERGQPGHEAPAVADDRVPPAGLDLGGVRAVRHVDQVPHRRAGVGQQPVEVDVQRREAVAGAAIGRGAPGDRERRSQVGLLGQQVGGPVAHAAGLAHEDVGVVADQVDQHVLVGRQPGQPRLHAVEGQALGQALPLLAAPRLQADEPLGALPDGGGRQQLAAREDLGSVDVADRALVADRELGQPVDLVAPQVDAHRAIGGRREHVDDRAPHGHLAAVLDHLLPAVAGGHQLGDEVVAVESLAGADGGRLDVLDVGPEPLHERPDRGHDDLGRAGGVAQAPQHPEPPAHRLDARADPLERQGLPGREQLDPVVAEVGAEVVRQPLGLGGGRDGEHDRPPPGQAGQAGDDEGAGRLADGEGRGGAAEHAGERRLVAQEGRQGVEGRASGRPSVCGGGCHGRPTLPAAGGGRCPPGVSRSSRSRTARPSRGPAPPA